MRTQNPNKWLSLIYVIPVLALALILSFQNCSDVSFSKLTPKADTSTTLLSDDALCTFNGKTYVNGDTVLAYRNSSVPADQTCESEIRICDNGTFSGSFQYASCTVGDHASCLFNGITYPHGTTITAYQNSSVPYGQTCVPTSKTCTDGVWSGLDYKYPTCTVNGPQSCLFNGVSYPHGAVVVAFQNPTVAFGQACVYENQVCNNGSFDSDHHYSYPTCTVDGPSSCLFNGRTLAHLQEVTVYPNSTVPYGQTCIGTVIQCYNGTMSGDGKFETCTPGAPASCLFNGKTIAHGETVTSYTTSTVPYGKTCTPVKNTCNNGVMSRPDAPYGACSINEPAACVFNGRTIASGESVKAYDASSVPYGSTCHSEMRMCLNGDLDGHDNFKYATCSVDAPKSCMFNGIQMADGQTISGYIVNYVQYPNTCASQVGSVTCHNGELSGPAKYTTCEVRGEPSTGQHCDVGGPWGWRSWYAACPSGKKLISASKVGGCPAGSLSYVLNGRTGCYYSNKDSRRPPECSTSDPADECCFWPCDAKGEDSIWGCVPYYEYNYSKDYEPPTATYLYDSCVDQFGRIKTVYNPPPPGTPAPPPPPDTSTGP